jgi:hypothetical protein
MTTYLTGVSTAEARRSERTNLGLLITPLNSTHLDVDAYPMFAADNGYYSLGAKADPTPAAELAAAERWGAWVVDTVAPLRARCLFVTIPDVLRWVTVEGRRVPVGDAEATLARFHDYAGEVRSFGLPVALVLQDGIELDELGLCAGGHRVDWDELDAVFVGGSTEFKLGPVAAAICREAQLRGKWSHVGRVNSWRRLDLVRSYADSVDGTFLGFGPTANWPRLTGWLDRLDADDFALAA